MMVLRQKCLITRPTLVLGLEDGLCQGNLRYRFLLSHPVCLGKGPSKHLRHLCTEEVRGPK